jgi:hypothetical protein
VLASYLIPGQFGGGRFQPLLRYQATQNPDMSIIDVFVAYVLAGPKLRFHLGFQRTDMGQGPNGDDVVGNAIQLGAQLLQL